MVHLSIRVPCVWMVWRNLTLSLQSPCITTGNSFCPPGYLTWRRREKSAAAAEQVSSDQRSEVTKPDLVGLEPKALGIASKVELSNSLVGPDTFVGDVLGHPIAGLLIRGLNPIGRVRCVLRVTNPWDDEELLHSYRFIYPPCRQ